MLLFKVLQWAAASIPGFSVLWLRSAQLHIVGCLVYLVGVTPTTFQYGTFAVIDGGYFAAVHRLLGDCYPVCAGISRHSFSEWSKDKLQWIALYRRRCS